MKYNAEIVLGSVEVMLQVVVEYRMQGANKVSIIRLYS